MTFRLMFYQVKRGDVNQWQCEAWRDNSGSHAGPREVLASIGRGNSPLAALAQVASHGFN